MGGGGGTQRTPIHQTVALLPFIVAFPRERIRAGYACALINNETDKMSWRWT